MVIAFVSGLLSNTSNFFHRWLLKDDDDPALYTWFLEAVRLSIAGVVLIFDASVTWSPKAFLLLLALGLVEVVSIYIYMRQHALAELSISTIISRTRLVWTALFAFVFLGEHLSLNSYAGILILFIGLAIGTAPHKIKRDRGMRYAYLSAIFISVTNVLAKEATAVASVAVIVAAMAIPTVVGYPIAMKNGPTRIRGFVRSNLLKKSLGALANVGALFLLLWAFETGSVSVANAIYQGTMVFAIVAGILFLRERHDIARKLAGTSLALVGVFLLTLGN